MHTMHRVQKSLPTITMTFLVASLWVWAAVAAAAPPAAETAPASSLKTEKDIQSCRVPRPAEFASILSFGYMKDGLPREDAKFEKIVLKAKGAGFNTIHCAYTDERLELCRKHGVRMMIDLLAPPYRFFSHRKEVEALCRKLRGDRAVWGYNLWNDSFGPHGPGLNKNVVTIRGWDPTHPTFIGTYCSGGAGHAKDVDAFGYYDYHWLRGRWKHFPHLLLYRKWAVQRRAIFCRWVMVPSGKSRRDVYQRNLYTINTSVACGLKGVLWFLGHCIMDRATVQLTPHGEEIARINHEVMPLRKLIMQIGNPVAVYSTPVQSGKAGTKAQGDKRVVPGRLQAFPKDFWLQADGGEFVMGVFKDDRKRDFVFVANHHHDAEQAVKLLVSEKTSEAELFDRKSEKWRPLEVTDGALTFTLAAAGGELLRFKRPTR